IFDSFECAIHALAPVCPHCGCHVIGHGVEQDGMVFCCVNCAQHTGVEGLIDRARRPEASQSPDVRRGAGAKGPYVIQRASESRCEWWTGSRWSGDASKARRYVDEPNPSAETGDEAADVESIEV